MTGTSSSSTARTTRASSIRSRASAPAGWRHAAPVQLRRPACHSLARSPDPAGRHARRRQPGVLRVVRHPQRDALLRQRLHQLLRHARRDRALLSGRRRRPSGSEQPLPGLLTPTSGDEAAPTLAGRSGFLFGASGFSCGLGRPSRDVRVTRERRLQPASTECSFWRSRNDLAGRFASGDCGAPSGGRARAVRRARRNPNPRAG